MLTMTPTPCGANGPGTSPFRVDRDQLLEVYNVIVEALGSARSVAACAFTQGPNRACTDSSYHRLLTLAARAGGLLQPLGPLDLALAPEEGPPVKWGMCIRGDSAHRVALHLVETTLNIAKLGLPGTPSPDAALASQFWVRWWLSGTAALKRVLKRVLNRLLSVSLWQHWCLFGTVGLIVGMKRELVRALRACVPTPVAPLAGPPCPPEQQDNPGNGQPANVEVASEEENPTESCPPKKKLPSPEMQDLIRKVLPTFPVAISMGEAHRKAGGSYGHFRNSVWGMVGHGLVVRGPGGKGFSNPQNPT
jgi:hypothetical protein